MENPDKNEDAEKSQDTGGSNNNNNSGSKSGSKSCKSFELAEDWGETFQGKCDPVLALLDFQLNSCQIIKTSFAPAQPSFFNNDAVVCIGADKEPRKYGLVYCYNRRAAIFHVNLSTNECSM